MLMSLVEPTKGLMRITRYSSALRRSPQCPPALSASPSGTAEEAPDSLPSAIKVARWHQLRPGAMPGIIPGTAKDAAACSMAFANAIIGIGES
jgi:hypothetical protein